MRIAFVHVATSGKKIMRSFEVNGDAHLRKLLKAMHANGVCLRQGIEGEAIPSTFTTSSQATLAALATTCTCSPVSGNVPATEKWLQYS